MMVRHVVWDWNGTLLDDVQACVEAINILLSRRSLPCVTREQYLDVFDFPVRNYYLRIGFDLKHENWHRLAVEYHEAYAKTSTHCTLRTGARQTLALLKARGISCSVLSACELSLLRQMMADRGILEYFEHVYGLTDLYAHSKLSLGHDMLAETGMPAGSSVLVGDTTHDFEVAEALGFPCLLMTGGHQSTGKLLQCKCPIAPDMAAVHTHICATDPT